MQQVTSVCSRTARLNNNQVKSRKRATSPEKGKSKRRQKMLCLWWKLYHRWVVSRETRSHQDFRKAWSMGETRGGRFWGQFRRVWFTQSTLRQASIRENRGPSLGKIEDKIPQQRSPYAMKFEDRSPEETARQERCARGDAWKLAKNIF